MRITIAMVLAVLLLLPTLGLPTGAVAQTVTAKTDTLPAFEIQKNTWMAVGQTAGLNVLIWSFNRFVREGGTNPGFRIGFNSWEENIKNGLEWDDNSFNTNQFAHPYHGSLYFNAARSNGFSYWESLPFSLGGSLMWEYIMEVHHPSYNDWIATGVGGAAFGESLHRLSNFVWDNQARGSNRFWREVGGFLINPMGGLNRLIRGDMNRYQANPADRYPSVFRSNIEFGTRTIGEENLWKSDTTRVYFKAGFAYGSPFEGDNEKPFDSFDFLIQVNFGDKSGIGQMNAKGLLFAVPVSESENSMHMLGAYQHIDYVDNNAYELGGQSFSGSYLSQIKMLTATLQTEFHANAVIMAATKSDYADFTGRSYCYGPGVGFKFRTALLRRGRPLFSLGHSSHWIKAINGDVAQHYVAYTFARLELQIGGIFGVGGEYAVYHAERTYADFDDVSQRNPEGRIFVNWIAD